LRILTPLNFMLAIQSCNLYDIFTVEAIRKSQTLEKTNIPCLYRSSDSGVLYGIFSRRGDQIKKSLKTTDKELARRRLGAEKRPVQVDADDCAPSVR